MMPSKSCKGASARRKKGRADTRSEVAETAREIDTATERESRTLKKTAVERDTRVARMSEAGVAIARQTTIVDTGSRAIGTGRGNQTVITVVIEVETHATMPREAKGTADVRDVVMALTSRTNHAHDRNAHHCRTALAPRVENDQSRDDDTLQHAVCQKIPNSYL